MSRPPFPAPDDGEDRAAEIRPVPPDDVRPLRQAVLRPHQTVDTCGFSGDDAADSGHFGAFVVGGLVGVATIVREARPDVAGERVWRIRGMATDPAHRGRGIGTALLDACVEHARAHGANGIWCNARIRATSLYARAGFATSGEPFELPDIGLHVVMELRLDDSP